MAQLLQLPARCSAVADDGSSYHADTDDVRTKRTKLSENSTDIYRAKAAEAADAYPGDDGGGSGKHVLLAVWERRLVSWMGNRAPTHQSCEGDDVAQVEGRAWANLPLAAGRRPRLAYRWERSRARERERDRRAVALVRRLHFRSVDLDARARRGVSESRPAGLASLGAHGRLLARLHVRFTPGIRRRLA